MCPVYRGELQFLRHHDRNPDIFVCGDGINDAIKQFPFETFLGVNVVDFSLFQGRDFLDVAVFPFALALIKICICQG